MKEKLNGKTAVVTGGNSGIGLAIAKRLVQEGAYVFIVGRRKPELDRAIEEIGKNVTAVQADVANLADLDRLYATVAEKKKTVDIVVANAGVVEMMPTAAATSEHFDKIFGINARGAYFTVQKALPIMNDGGSIILVGSGVWLKGFPAYGVYAGTKAALRSFVRTWTTELKPQDSRQCHQSGRHRNADSRWHVPNQGSRRCRAGYVPVDCSPGPHWPARRDRGRSRFTCFRRE